MTTMYKEIPEQKTVEFIIYGKVTKEDFDQISEKLHKFIEAHGTIKLIEVIQSFEGFDPSVIWDGIKFDIQHLRFISHCAVVSDNGWISPISKAAGAFISTKLRTFSLVQLDEARQWLKSPDTSENS
ncbi:MAG: STAS/SEC14 domain-containing protein [Nitrosomonadales bacterium]|nr:MAG: STAS/SEC14 domain-containing protein [Nitrosomonadales bacterium]